MTERKDGAPPAVLASVVVLAMADFAHRSAAEQTDLRAQLEALTGVAIQPLAAAERIVLDAPGALVVAVLEGPAAALALAERARAAAGELPLRIGVEFGPVFAADDGTRGARLTGEGVGAALELADAAAPGRMLASPRFRDALAASAAAEGAARALRTQRMALFSAAAAALLALALGARALRPPPAPPVRPAALQFEIKPRGDIYLDGKLKGQTPPLKHFEVNPGPHTVEVRNGAFAPLRIEMNLASAEQMTIRHEFVAPKPPPAPPHHKPKKEPRKEAKKEPKKAPVEEPKKEQKKEPTEEEAKKDINWGDNIRRDFENARRKLGF
jgi:class 3 adenylate cyclase